MVEILLWLVAIVFAMLMFFIGGTIVAWAIVVILVARWVYLFYWIVFVRGRSEAMKNIVMLLTVVVGIIACVMLTNYYHSIR